jgi:hypothetical protein
MDWEYFRARTRATLRFLRPRCRAVFPGGTRRPIRCQHYRGHDGDHRSGPVIRWANPTVTDGHVHVGPGRRR